LFLFQGFHDGYIFSVAQKQVMDDGELRPVLVYRIKYNDGDEEGERSENVGDQ
jgi:hypothetical protein